MKRISNYKLICLLIICLFSSAVFAQTKVLTEKAANEWVKKGEWRHGFKPKVYAGMDNVEFAKQYQANKAWWDKAFTFLANTNLDTLSVGKHPIDGENVFATVTEAPDKEMDKTAWESHRKYIDLQYVIKGKEKIGMAPLSTTTVTKPYNETSDGANYTAEGTFYMADPNVFFLFFPQNAHRPSVKVDDSAVKKIVIKIKVAQ
jgi:YhcH/YjgK/YiaL family protein